MLWTLSSAPRVAAALAAAAGVAVLSVAPALAQATPAVSVNPNQGAPGSQFTITLSNYSACAADSPNCVIIDFVQSGVATRIGVADSHGASSFSGNVSVPPGAWGALPARLPTPRRSPLQWLSRARPAKTVSLN